MVSVVIPCYNSERTIARAVSSALAQSVTDIEVIVVDDGSTDGSLRALAQISSGDAAGRVVVLSQANAGPAVARNAGIARSRGEYVCFLDSDDWWEPTKIEEQLRCLSDARLALLGLRSPDARNPQGSWERAGFPRIMFRNPFMTSSVIVDRRLIPAGSLEFPSDKKYSEDYLLWMRIAAVAPCGVLRSRAAVHEIGVAGSLSGRLWRMEVGELGALARSVIAHDKPHQIALYGIVLPLAAVFSLLKFAIRVLRKLLIEKKGLA